MKVLVACEESQRVCTAFREKGHDAYSCDIEPCSGGHPEWHIQDDVLKHLNENWDLIIAHPPCTYLTNGGTVQMFRKETKSFPPYGNFQLVNVDRLKNGIKARDFFMNILNYKCPKIAIENPMPMSIYQLPKPTQVIQPYEFGEPYSKKTYLWLKGLPCLKPTNILTEYQPFINGGGGRLEKENYKNKKFANGGTKRSKTFQGIADAMAEQWG